MTYQFNPLTEEELNAVELVEDGIYDFEVIKSVRKVSRTGNHMAELNIRFWDKNGKIHTLFDYLVFSIIPLNIRKVKHFCDATGLAEYYKKGELPEELGGYSGKIKVSTQKGQLIPQDKLNGKPLGSTYPDKNIVEYYVLTDKGAVKYQAPISSGDMNDDFPF
jgi:hypothetical protein